LKINSLARPEFEKSLVKCGMDFWMSSEPAVQSEFAAKRRGVARDERL